MERGGFPAKAAAGRCPGATPGRPRSGGGIGRLERRPRQRRGPPPKLCLPSRAASPPDVTTSALCPPRGGTPGGSISSGTGPRLCPRAEARRPALLAIRLFSPSAPRAEARPGLQVVMTGSSGPPPSRGGTLPSPRAGCCPWRCASPAPEARRPFRPSRRWTGPLPSSRGGTPHQPRRSDGSSFRRRHDLQDGPGGPFRPGRPVLPQWPRVRSGRNALRRLSGRRADRPAGLGCPSPRPTLPSLTLASA